METQSATNPACSRCGGLQINTQLTAPGLGNQVYAKVGIERSELLLISAYLCVQCGHVELYVQLNTNQDPHR